MNHIIINDKIKTKYITHYYYYDVNLKSFSCKNDMHNTCKLILRDRS